MATLDKEASYHEIEHELILCEGCGNVITTRKHLEEIRKKIEDVGLLDKDRANIENLCSSCKRHHVAGEIKEAMALE